MASYGFAQAHTEHADELQDIADDAEHLQHAVHSFVEEASELSSLILSLSEQRNQHDETRLKRIIDILEKYQEQPQLLDPHLENIITPLMQFVCEFSDDQKFIYNCLKFVYILSKVRGFKTVGMRYNNDRHVTYM